MFSLGLWQVCGSGERCWLRVIHPNLISPLALASLGASQPLTASPQDDEPPGCFSPPSVPWWSGILGKSHPSSAVAAHLPPTLQPGAACLPACLPPASTALIPALQGHPPPGCLDIPPPAAGHPWASPNPPGNKRDRWIRIRPLCWVSRHVPSGLCLQTLLPPTHVLSAAGAKP